MLGKSIIAEIDKKQEQFEQLSMNIWENPEVAFEEKKACTLIAQFLQKEGFQVEIGYANLPTAIRAVWGGGKPVIGFLGEYDALPGMSQKVATKKEPVIENDPGQGCGHNLLGVAHVAAAIGLKKEMTEKNLPGTIIFYGCPAEETLIGKGLMAKEGAFEEIDMSFSWHPAPYNEVSTGRSVACNGVKFHFKGITAHAGGDPENGRSALDAAELMNVGTNYLREHVTDDVRFHYCYTDGGTVPNIVPDKASVWYYVRALSREAVNDAYERLIKVAKGAALMTETKVEVEFLGGCYNTLQNHVLLHTVHETMQEILLPEWTKEEIEFAKELNKTSANFNKMVASGKINKDTHIDNVIPPITNNNWTASTDVGDVMHIAPGVFFMTTASNIGAAFHSWHITASSGSSIGMKGMIYAGKIMAISALKAVENPIIVEKAWKEFEKTMNGKTYECPLP